MNVPIGLLASNVPQAWIRSCSTVSTALAQYNLLLFAFSAPLRETTFQEILVEDKLQRNTTPYSADHAHFLQLLNPVDERANLGIGKQSRCSSRMQQDHDVILGIVAGADAINQA